MKPKITLTEERKECGTEYTFRLDGEILMQPYDPDYEDSNGEGAKSLCECLHDKGIIIFDNSANTHRE